MRQKTYNDIPPETIVRHMAEERGRLLAEIDELKDQVASKDRAIASFKRWQSKVAEYKWNYWLSEGVRLMETPPDSATVKRLARLIDKSRMFGEWARKVSSSLEAFEKAKRDFSNTINKDNHEEEK